MNTIIFIAIFSIGIVFGSFFTLAVYRIPRKEDIVHVRSHCTTCNHRLDFWDLIPIFSYLFLRGKCRYCGDKIRIRYFLLEVLSGIVFLSMAYTRGITYNSDIISFINLAFIYLFIAGTFIIAGIDKEKKIIPNGLVIYGLIVGIIYTIFKIAIGKNIVSNLTGLLLIPLLLLLINIIAKNIFKSENKLPFGMGDIKYISIIGLFAGFGIQLLTIFLAIIIIGVNYLLSSKMREDKEIKLGFYLSLAINVLLIMQPYIVDIINSIELMLII